MYFEGFGRQSANGAAARTPCPPYNLLPGPTEPRAAVSLLVHHQRVPALFLLGADGNTESDILYFQSVFPLTLSGSDLTHLFRVLIGCISSLANYLLVFLAYSSIEVK